MKFFLIVMSLFVVNSFAEGGLEPTDLLSKYGQKPKNLIFISCEKGMGQTVLEAKYGVSGKKSLLVESFLVKNYGLGELKFTCCGWESKDGKNGSIEHAEFKRENPDHFIVISMYGNAEKLTEEGESYLEIDRKKVDFVVEVKVIKV